MSAVNFRNRIAAAIGAIALALGSVVLTSAPANAADVTVNSGVDLALAIGSASSGDTITLGSSFTLSGDLPQITVPLTIRAAGSDTVTLGANDYDVFNIAAGAGAVTIEGFGITDAGNTNSTFAIDSATPNLTVNDIAVTGSYGGLRINAGGGTITNSSFQSSGRGVLVEGLVTTTVTFSNDDFSDNNGDGFNATLDGISVLNIDHSTSNRNTAGKGFVISPSAVSEVTLDTVEASDNIDGGFELWPENAAQIHLEAITANRNGGIAMYIEAIEGTIVTLDGLDADSNDSTGLWVETTAAAEVTITDVTATHNDGEGIFAFADEATEISISGATTSNNSLEGTYAQASEDAVVTLSDLTSIENSLEGVWLEADTGGTMTLNGATSRGNDGPGIRLESYSTGSVSVESVLSTANNATGAFIELSYNGKVDVKNSTFSSNDRQGVDITTDGNDGEDSEVTITGTTIKDNSDNGFDGGGVNVAKAVNLTVNIADSTISGNTAFDGGGIYVDGNDDAEDPPALFVTIENSTISGNVAEVVGGIYVDGQNLSSNSEVNILNSTITSNTVTLAGPAGLSILGEFNASIRNSIVADNIDEPEFYGDLDVSSALNLNVAYSLVRTPSPDAATFVTAGTGNIAGVSAKLGPLANNGGPTFTHLPLSGSPAINAGEPGFSALAYDQRGLDRVFDRLDMGAVEVQLAELAETGADAVWPLGAGAVVLGLGVALVVFRRRLASSTR